MRKPLVWQNIEEMRAQEGIDDVDLRLGIRALKVGDFVKLTLVKSASAFETRLVRITSIRGCAFRGKLAGKRTPASSAKAGAAKAGAAKSRSGDAFAFTTAHIHSIWKDEAKHGR